MIWLIKANRHRQILENDNMFISFQNLLAMFIKKILFELQYSSYVRYFVTFRWIVDLEGTRFCGYVTANARRVCSGLPHLI